MSNKTIAITGGNSGIGLSLTKHYLRAGHQVAVITRSSANLDTLKREYADALMTFVGDVRSPESLAQFYSQTFKQFKRIDVVIANAGIANAISPEHATTEEFDATFDTNVKGVFFTVQKSLDYLKPGASIVLISSIQAEKGAGAWAVYGASKAAVRSLARSFAAELGSRNIRVNCISPGVTQTPIFDKFGLDAETLESALTSIRSETPLGRLGEPDEIAQAIAFINSPAASFITGADLQVDGGLIQV